MPPSPSQPTRIAILGAGEVGSLIAYSLILNPLASEILLVDPKTSARDAQVQDLSDATFHGPSSLTRVRSGTHSEAGQCDIIVITAGAKQKQGESRTDLIGRNLEILKSALGDMKPFRKDAVLLLVANPVDVLTEFAVRISGLPRGQVVGSGTFLDSVRLRGILAAKVGVAASEIEAFVLGEHGDSQMVAWSVVGAGGVSLDRLVEKGATLDKQGIAEETKKKAGAIMESKGSTAFGIGGVTASICASILFDRRNIVPVSHYQERLGVCLSMPAVIGRKGIVRTIDIPLEDQEQAAIEKSAKSLKEVIEEAEKKSS